MPDAVIVLQPSVKLDMNEGYEIVQYRTKYCNERVDEFFNLDLSKLSEEELEGSSYKLIKKRNL